MPRLWNCVPLSAENDPMSNLFIAQNFSQMYEHYSLADEDLRTADPSFHLPQDRLPLALKITYAFKAPGSSASCSSPQMASRTSPPRFARLSIFCEPDLATIRRRSSF